MPYVLKDESKVRLVIVGEGSLRTDLEAEAVALVV